MEGDSGCSKRKENTPQIRYSKDLQVKFLPCFIGRIYIKFRKTEESYKMRNKIKKNTFSSSAGREIEGEYYLEATPLSIF